MIHLSDIPYFRYRYLYIIIVIETKVSEVHQFLLSSNAYEGDEQIALGGNLNGKPVDEPYCQ